MSLAIPEFSDEEIATVQANLDHRWGAGKPALELIVASRNRIALLQRLFGPVHGHDRDRTAAFDQQMLVVRHGFQVLTTGGSRRGPVMMGGIALIVDQMT